MRNQENLTILKSLMRPIRASFHAGIVHASRIVLAVVSMWWLESYAKDNDSDCRPPMSDALSQYNGLAASMNAQVSTNVLVQYNGLAAKMGSPIVDGRAKENRVGDGYNDQMVNYGSYQLHDVFPGNYRDKCPGYYVYFNKMQRCAYKPNGMTFAKPEQESVPKTNLDGWAKENRGRCGYNDHRVNYGSYQLKGQEEWSKMIHDMRLMELNMRHMENQAELAAKGYENRALEDLKEMHEYDVNRITGTTKEERRTMANNDLEEIDHRGAYEIANPVKRNRHTGELYKVKSDGSMRQVLNNGVPVKSDR